MKIPISQIDPNPEQPRTIFDNTKLQELANSIRESGLQHPITVEFVTASGRYQIIDGERRWRAHQLLKADEIEVVVRPFSGESAQGNMTRLVSALVSNEQSETLSHVERARAYKRIMDLAEEAGHPMKPASLGRKIGKSTGHVKHVLSILDLDPDLQAMIHHGEFSADPRVISPLSQLPQEVQLELARRLIQRNASIKAMIMAINRMLATMGRRRGPGRRKSGADHDGFLVTPTPSLHLALDTIVELPDAAGRVPAGGLRRIALQLCSECPELPADALQPPSWLLLQRAAKQTCGECEMGQPENRNLQICKACPAVQLLKISAGIVEVP